MKTALFQMRLGLMLKRRAMKRARMEGTNLSAVVLAFLGQYAAGEVGSAWEARPTGEALVVYRRRKSQLASRSEQV